MQNRDCLPALPWHPQGVNWLTLLTRCTGHATTLLATGLSLTTLAADSWSTRENVGAVGTNRWYTPANQLLTPAGLQIDLPGMRPQALALSPGGRFFVTAGKTHDLVVVDVAAGGILQRVALPSDKDQNPAPVSTEILTPDKTGQLSFTGIVFSPDGTRIYLSNVNGDIKVFSVARDGKVSGLFTIPLPRVSGPRRGSEIPAGLAVSADGTRLYAAMNLTDQLAELDTATGKLLRTWDVGVAPFGVTISGKKVYVSNWGGRRPAADSLTGPAGQLTTVRVDPVRHIASEGSVSVISPDSASKSVQSEIVTGLHASALTTSPDGLYVVVANTGSDTLSVIDTRTDKIIETLWTRQSPGDLFGAQPTALTFDPTGKKLFVCNGTQNAVAVIDFKPGKSSLLGLIPTGWFPGAIAYDPARHTLCVANIKGIGSTAKIAPGEPVKYASPQSYGTLSLIPEPSKRELGRLTQIALHNMRHGLLRQAMLPPRANQPPRVVPERAGEPSLIKHVVYIIKENRTYDQVLGDVREGNGDPSLCVFPDRITPNQHKLSREFVLLDNTYCSGINSADGHQWADSAIASDYIERSFAGFPRSYPYYGDDALAYAPTGFIWDNALAHGRTLRDYGEYTLTDVVWADASKKNRPRWLDVYRDYTNQSGLIKISSHGTVPPLRPHVATNTAGFSMNVSDQFRAGQFINDLRESERTGNFPNLIILLLPSDHTSGTSAGSPTPAAMVADNDLAMGRVVEALSRSRFWKDTCVLAIEDDPQAGWDHVSGYRTTAYVASPYTRRGAVVSTQYNQTSLVRTIELMLGLPPMNQLDATATPMSDCFTNTPDLRPFTAVASNVPLDEMNPDPKAILNPQLKRNARISARLPLTLPDQCPEDTLNRILWAAMKGPQTPYPTWAVKTVRDED